MYKDAAKKIPIKGRRRAHMAQQMRTTPQYKP